jgi:hypothetical protein
MFDVVIMVIMVILVILVNILIMVNIVILVIMAIFGYKGFCGYKGYCGCKGIMKWKMFVKIIEIFKNNYKNLNYNLDLTILYYLKIDDKINSLF